MASEFVLPWHPGIVTPSGSMEALLALSYSWLRTVCTVAALLWLSFRAYQVLMKPVDELISLLGFDVPPAPDVSLGAVKVDGVMLHWKPPRSKNAVAKYLVKVNHAFVSGDIAPSESSVQVYGLQPDSWYTILVVAVNVQNFQSPSTPIRVKTRPAASGEIFDHLTVEADHDGNNDSEQAMVPHIRACKPIIDIAPPSPAPQPMHREHSNSQSQSRKLAGQGRRASPVSAQHLAHTDYLGSLPDDDETVTDLQERLKNIQKEAREIEAMLQEDLQEHDTNRESLMAQRDELKAELRRREDESREARGNASTLQKQLTAATQKKQTQERTFQQKHQERQKLKDDTVRWEREASELHADTERIWDEKSKLLQDTEDQIEHLKAQHEAELQANRDLEESIRTKGSQIKNLEEARLVENNDQEVERLGLDVLDAQFAEEDRQAQARFNSLQATYRSLHEEVGRAGRWHNALQERLTYLSQQRRVEHQHPFSPISALDSLQRRDSQRRRHGGSYPSDGPTSASSTGFVPNGMPFNVNGSVSSASPAFSPQSQFFNPANGMTLTSLTATTPQTEFTEKELDILTGSGPMSPTHARELLPSDLLGDDRDDRSLSSAEADDDGRQGSGSATTSARHPPPLPGLGGLPGLGAPANFDQMHQPGPSSPTSPQSRSPSVFASPRESSGHLPFYQNADLMEADRRSIRSAASSQRHQPSRFTALFSRNRSRGHTLSEDGPMFGSLKPAQSQSMPRHDDSQEPIGTRPRRGSDAGGTRSLLNSVSNLVSRDRAGSKAAEQSDNGPKHVATRRRPFEMFGRAPWAGPTIPGEERPPSSSSVENNFLPRPSNDSGSNFGWPADPHRNSPRLQWPIPEASPWSRHPSRRPSLQHNLPTLISEDSTDSLPDHDFPYRSSPIQAPIGTRPISSQNVPAPTTPPQLNPKAPTFTSSVFSRKGKDKIGDEADEEVPKPDKPESRLRGGFSFLEKRDKSKKDKKARDDDSEAVMPLTPMSEFGMSTPQNKDLSPPDPRMSRDQRSISTANDSLSISATSPRVSMEHSGTLSRTESETQVLPTVSESLGSTAGSSASKESFMQKLSRKSSSGMFGFGKRNKDKSGMGSELGTPTPEAFDEDAMVRSVGSLDGSPLIGALIGADADVIKTPNTEKGERRKDRGEGSKSSHLSWSSIKSSMGRKKGDKTPSLHESIASEAPEEEDEEGQDELEGSGILVHSGAAA